MNQQFTVLLYSQYSPNSKRILDYLKECPVDLTTVTGLCTVCIDNAEVRAKIIKSTQIDIQVVPSILIVHPDGGVEKYDGGNAFRWVEEVIQKYTPVNPPQPVVHDDIESHHTPEEKPKHPAIGKRRPPAQAPSEPIPVLGTSLEDLDVLEDLEDDYTPPKRPPASMMLDSGNTMQGEFGVADEPNRNPTHGIRTSTQPTKSGKVDIMAAAQAMQKDRDVDFEKQRPVGMPNER
jgi:hypothetical protein